MPRGGSLARRVLLGAGLWCLIVLLGGGLALSGLYRSQTQAILETDLDATLVDLSRSVDLDEEGYLIADEDRLPKDSRYNTPLSGHYWIILDVGPDGDVFADIRPPSMWDGDAPVPAARLAKVLSSPGDTLYYTTVGPADDRIRVAARTIVLSDDGSRTVLVAAKDLTATDQSAQRFMVLLLGAMAVLAAGVLFALVAQIRLVLKPLERIEADLADVREGSRQTLDQDYPDEVRPLTTELNKLIEHNRGVVERARTHVGNLAHALKTPLAVLRNEATGETALDDVVRRQSESMSSNVDHYLKRAQAAARAELLGARSDVSEIVDGLVRLLNGLYGREGVTVSHVVEDSLVVRTESQDLEEMLGNLMENGCKWASSEVAVASEAGEEGWVLLHVDDDGDGLTKAQMESAIQRGVRLDETAPGTGLGLNIVSELSEMYGGGLELSRSPMGGLRATLRLPAA